MPGATTDGLDIREAPLNFDAIFHLHYKRITHAIARVVGDRACAEELAIEAFWKLSRHPHIEDENAGAWLYRTAIHLGISELRRRARHLRYRRLLHLVNPATPEELRAATEEQEQVRLVLAAIRPACAELLLLRSHDFTYDEIAATLNLNSASVGTLISRARQAFRKEYTKHYGEPRNGD